MSANEVPSYTNSRKKAQLAKSKQLMNMRWLASNPKDTRNASLFPQYLRNEMKALSIKMYHECDKLSLPESEDRGTASQDGG